jgi:hypothetical protein
MNPYLLCICTICVFSLATLLRLSALFSLTTLFFSTYISLFFLLQVYEFCTSSEFEGSFEAFSKEFSDIFMKVLDFNATDEHPLEFHDVYREYLDRFERKIESFIVDQGFDPLDFYRECQELLESDKVFGTRKFFVGRCRAFSRRKFSRTGHTWSNPNPSPKP